MKERWLHSINDEYDNDDDHDGNSDNGDAFILSQAPQTLTHLCWWFLRTFVSETMVY